MRRRSAVGKWRRPARRRPPLGLFAGRIGNPELHPVPAPVDLGVDLPEHHLLGVVGLGWRPGGATATAEKSRRSSTQRVEWRAAMKSGCGEDGLDGRDRRGDALDLHLRQGPDQAPAGGVAVVAPDDDLRDEVVVELGDGVAGLVPGVGPHAEALGKPEGLVIFPGLGRNLPPAGSSALIRASMACPRLRAAISSCDKGIGSPAAIRSCHSTRSSPSRAR